MMKSFLYSTKHCPFCLYGFFRPSREFFTHLAIEQLRFFNVPHLLYTSQPFIMVVTPTHVAERLAVRLSLPVLKTSDLIGDRNLHCKI